MYQTEKHEPKALTAFYIKEAVVRCVHVHAHAYIIVSGLASDYATVLFYKTTPNYRIAHEEEVDTEGWMLYHSHHLEVNMTLEVRVQTQRQFKKELNCF